MEQQPRKGKFVITAIPDQSAHDAITAYLSKLFKNASSQQFTALLGKLPATVIKDAPEPTALKLIAALQKLGATAEFHPHPTVPPVAKPSAEPALPSKAALANASTPPPKNVAEKARTITFSAQKSEKKQHASPYEEIREAVFGAFHEKFPRPNVSVIYTLSLLFVAAAMLLLPLLHVALIGGIAYGMYWHGTEHLSMFQEIRPVKVAFLLYATPLFVGVMALIALLTPFFRRAQQELPPYKLSPADEPLLFDVVEKICEEIGAPIPQEIHLTMDVNAFAWRRSFFSSDFVLTLGMPLIAGFDISQFAGVLAHEFGHFSQKTATRLRAIIMTVNNWFADIVYEPNDWTEKFGNSGHYIALMSWVARLFLWGTRLFFQLLMLLGHAISCFMSRQMEFNADTYATRLVGADVFEAMMQRLVSLSLATSLAHQDLHVAWQENRLADNLPGLILANEPHIPAHLLQQAFHAKQKARTGIFDLHPSHRERVRMARRYQQTPFFELSPSESALQKYAHVMQMPLKPKEIRSFLPASLLFRDFEKLSQKATSAFYRNLIGKEVSTKRLVSTEALMNAPEDEREQIHAAACFFLLPFHLLSAPDIGSVTLMPPQQPQAAVNLLKKTRQQAQSMRVQYIQAFDELQQGYDRLFAATQIEALRHSGIAVEAPKGEPLSILRRQVESRIKTLAPVEQMQRSRMEAALQLLMLPNVAAKIPESQQMQKDAQDILTLLQGLEQQFAALQEIHVAQEQLRALLEYAEWFDGAEETKPQILALSEALQPMLFEMKKALSTHSAAQLASSQKRISLGEFLLADLPKQADPYQLLSCASGLVQRFPAAYLRLLGKLAQTVETVERLCIPNTIN